jgi:uncharacterized protein DUF3352
MVRIRFGIPLFAVALALLVAGCGEDDAGSSESSSTGPAMASFAPPGSVVYVEGDLKPTGETKSNVDSVVAIVSGSNTLGGLVTSKLEESARESGETFDYQREVKPWLGEKASVAFEKIEGDGDLSEPLIAIETTDEAASQKFIDARASQGGNYRSSSYEGIEIEIGGSEQNAIGVFDGSVVIADDEAAFKAAVDASNGDSLADEARFADAIAAASTESFADVYVDVGAVIDQSPDRFGEQASETVESAGIDPSEATAVASVIPGAEEIEVELSSDLGGEEPPSGDASELLGSMPADSFAAFAVSGFGEQLQEAIDNLDENGLEPDLQPGELKDTLNEAGIDLDDIAASVEDAAVFAEGDSKPSLGGAMVLSVDESGEATEAIAQLGTLLRGAGAPGITALKDGAAGFSVRSPELGDKPLVVATEGSRIAIGYGLAQTMTGLEAGGATLSGDATYQAAVASLGKTPISAFVDGPAALALADALVPRSESDYQEAKPYLRKIAYLALGNTEQDELPTAKLIVGLEK